MNYSTYQLTFSDYVRIVVFSLVLSVLISDLFYDSWIGMICALPCVVIFRKVMRKQKIEEQQKQLGRQFLDAMQLVSNSLLAGYSMENAWKEAEAEMCQLYGEQALMCMEIKQMNQAVSLNVALEELLEDFADRSGIEDIKNFSEVFSFAKRSGGNMISIIQDTTNHMRARLEVQQEIEVLVAAKKLEQKVLNVIPIGILAYLKYTSGDYLSVLYGNLMGIMFMTAALGAYLAAIMLSRKILTIQM